MPQITDLQQQAPDPDVEYILNLEAKLEIDFNRSQQEYAEQELEVDSISDCFGTIFRVWRGKSVIGTFYQTVSGNGWIAEAFSPNHRPQWCATSEQAQNLIRSVR